MTVMSPVCPLLCLSVSVVSIGLNCKVLQDSDVLKCREVGLFLEASPDRTHLEEPVCLSVSVFGDVPPDLLLQPNISVSSSVNGVSEAQQQGFQVFRGSTFTISCSIQPQYPGGSFQLAFTSSITSHNYTQPAVNHSAHFLFPAAEPAHQGNYSCVYHLHVFSHDFSSESRRLSLTVSDATGLLIKVVVLPLTLLLVIAALCFYYKASRGQKPGRQENIELHYYNVGVSAAEGGSTEEEGAQGAE
ncbi:uncharacterized protein LOC119912702 [Micropterus salmoides]|uniref:uncharacterized protein LOC119912702 n=1 Tax=Micropterus salmoides TaxID=27706 RepID=UPI0018ED7317|nr:uncharacterized protein LOC119912702 [Micropterus salmoides]